MSESGQTKVRLIAIDQLDLLELYKLWRGRDYCDDVEDRRDCLIVLPGAIEDAEKLTGKSISRKVYELSGSGELGCEIELPHPPVTEVLCVERRTGSDPEAWKELPSSSYEFKPDLAGNCRTLRLVGEKTCRPCACPNGCQKPDLWRIRYATGSPDGCEVPVSGSMLKLIFLLAEQCDDHDAARQKTIDRMVARCKIKSH